MNERFRGAFWRKRSRIARTAVSLAVLLLFFLSALPLVGLHLSPDEAARHSENGLRFGPSEPLAVYPVKGGRRLYIGRYGNQISCCEVRRFAMILWTNGAFNTGKIEPEEPLSIAARYVTGEESSYCYGLRNDPAICRVEVILGNGTVLSVDTFVKDTFFFTWRGTNGTLEDVRIKRLTAYDEAGEALAAYGASLKNLKKYPEPA